MKAIFRDFLSNRALFFDQFDLAAKNVVEMGLMLEAVVSAQTNDQTIYKQITKKESIGDDITHKIYLQLDKTMFTPFNKTDIHSLASGIDDVADTICEASNRMNLYNVHEFSSEIKEIAAIILKASIEIGKAIDLLRWSKLAELQQLCGEIKNYKRRAEKAYYTAVSKLFSDEKDAIKVIKYREILLSLENAVNKCKNVANALDTIVVNN